MFPRGNYMTKVITPPSTSNNVPFTWETDSPCPELKALPLVCTFVSFDPLVIFGQTVLENFAMLQKSGKCVE